MTTIPTQRTPQLLSRRTVGAGLAGLSLLPSTAALTAPTALDLDTDAGLVAALMKMRAATDGSIRFGWLEASRSAYIDGEIYPLLDLLAGFVVRARQTGKAEYAAETLEITYYLDRESGELLDRLRMPVTGRIVEVPLYRSGPKVVPVARRHTMRETTAGSAGVTADSEGRTKKGAFAPAGRVELDRSVGPYRIDGDHCWIRTSEYGRVTPSDPGGARLFYNESTTWHGNLEQLLDPAAATVSATLSYAAATSWRPWMQMGEVQGHTMSNGFGRKVMRLEDMPAQWLELTATHHPDIIEAPAQALAGDNADYPD